MSDVHLLPYHNDILLTKSKIPFRKLGTQRNGAYVWQDLTAKQGSCHASGTRTVYPTEYLKS